VVAQRTHHMHARTHARDDSRALLTPKLVGACVCPCQSAEEAKETLQVGWLYHARFPCAVGAVCPFFRHDVNAPLRHDGLCPMQGGPLHSCARQACPTVQQPHQGMYHDLPSAHVMRSHTRTL
jgi:hypothetical protein